MDRAEILMPVLALVCLTLMVLFALGGLIFEWTHREEFPIAERSVRMARLLADALAPGPGETAKRR